MNWATIEGNWKEAKAQVKDRWGRLTDDDLMQVEGKRDRLLGVIQQKYGLAKEKAEEQLNEFIEASEGWIESTKENVKEAVERGRHYLQESSATQMATDLKDFIGRYPVYATLIGVGIGYMIGRVCSNTRG